MSENKSTTIVQPLFFVTGSTGTGKSNFAVNFAEHLGKHRGYSKVAVINCDVSQFYKDLPIATNKITVNEARNVPHVFMNFLASDNSFVAHPSQTLTSEPLLQFKEAPSAPFEGIHTFSQLVSEFIDEFFTNFTNGALIICGGTNYYMQSVLFSNSIHTNVDGKEIVEEGNALWERLNKIDPITAGRYHPNDTRRLRRLIAIAESSGKKLTEVFTPAKFRYPPERCIIIWLYVPIRDLSPMLDQRVVEMIERGLLEEVSLFFSAKNKSGTRSSIFEAIGVKELEPALTVGIPNEENHPNDELLKRAVQQIKSNTKHYAEKQVRWLSNRFSMLLSESDGESQMKRNFIKINLGKKSKEEEVQRFCEMFFDNDLSGNFSEFDFPLEEGQYVEPKESVSSQRCELCDLVVCGRNAFEQHIKSKRHKAALKRRALEREYFERFGTPLPAKRSRE